ncbi:EP300-interacting inhibitor of differentiation 3 [Neodiprion pinetum]|uniref:EP300-interacting inhibitor of differentiation 3 n=1 Tax=Neodiprion pinetum TaxID=441929 RepID=UPI001EDCB8C7|nr:EP300-interacting inhibitor of differentiation 3 [Neodiprion pinetum]
MSDNENNVSVESSHSPQKRKAFYREYLGKTKVLQENVGKNTITTLRTIMANTDIINEDEEAIDKANYTDEVLLDSEVMYVSSDVLKRCTETLNKDMSPYDHTEFAEKILSYVRLRPDTMLEEAHWPILTDEVLNCLNVTPQYSYLLGTLKPLEKRHIAKRKQGPRDIQVATKRPENVQAVDKVEHGVEETVRKIKTLVSHHYKTNDKPLDFFKLILNPVDFGRTVENMLHVSFLIRDGLLQLTKDKRGKLVVQPSSKEACTNAKRKGNDSHIQNVMSINAGQWQILKETYHLDGAMINFTTSVHL